MVKYKSYTYNILVESCVVTVSIFILHRCSSTFVATHHGVTTAAAAGAHFKTSPTRIRSERLVAARGSSVVHLPTNCYSTPFFFLKSWQARPHNGKR